MESIGALGGFFPALLFFFQVALFIIAIIIVVFLSFCAEMFVR